MLTALASDSQLMQLLSKTGRGYSSRRNSVDEMKQKVPQQANQTLSNLRVESNCRHVVRVAFECSDASLCLVIPNLRAHKHNTSVGWYTM